MTSGVMAEPAFLMTCASSARKPKMCARFVSRGSMQVTIATFGAGRCPDPLSNAFAKVAFAFSA